MYWLNNHKHKQINRSSKEVIPKRKSTNCILREFARQLKDAMEVKADEGLFISGKKLSIHICTEWNYLSSLCLGVISACIFGVWLQ